MRSPDQEDKQDSLSANGDPATVALFALAWTLGDERRAERLLSLTGLDASALRDGIENPTILAAALDFLADHEPDLIACAEAIDVTPAALIAAKGKLRR